VANFKIWRTISEFGGQKLFFLNFWRTILEIGERLSAKLPRPNISSLRTLSVMFIFDQIEIETLFILKSSLFVKHFQLRKKTKSKTETKLKVKQEQRKITNAIKTWFQNKF
jgi:hypothetical protein